MGIGLGAISRGASIAFDGVTEGLRRSKMVDRMDRQEAREDVRFEHEKKQMAEKDAQIAARQEFQTQLQQIHAEAASGQGDFSQFGYTGDPANPPKANPFKATADGLYKNQRAADKLISERRAAALENLYAKLGEPEKAIIARSQMSDLFEKDVERKTKAALAGFAVGAPGAVEAMAKVYSYINDGVEIDPRSGQFDKKTGTWTGVRLVNTKTGEATERDFTQRDIVGLASQDAAAIAKFNTEQGRADRDETRRDRALTADETRAGAAATGAQAAMRNADSNMAQVGVARERLAIARENAKQEQKGADQKAKTEAILKIFPLATKELKEEELMMSSDKGVALKSKKSADERMAQMTFELSGLNPTVPLAALATVARKGKVTAEADDKGRPFTMVGTTRVYLQ